MAILVSASPAKAQSTTPGSLEAVIAQTTADTASVALAFPRSTQTVLIKRILCWYDNAANTNPFYVGIVAATAAQTVQFWLGTAMVTSGIATVSYENLNKRIDPATAQAGVRVFASAASSDSIMVKVEYELIPK